MELKGLTVATMTSLFLVIEAADKFDFIVGCDVVDAQSIRVEAFDDFGDLWLQVLAEGHVFVRSRQRSHHIDTFGSQSLVIFDLFWGFGLLLALLLQRIVANAAGKQVGRRRSLDFLEVLLLFNLAIWILLAFR